MPSSEIRIAKTNTYANAYKKYKLYRFQLKQEGKRRSEDFSLHAIKKTIPWQPRL